MSMVELSVEGGDVAATAPVRVARQRRPRREVVQGTVVHVLLAALGIAFLAPLAWLIESAFNPQASQSLVWPRSLSFANFSAAISAGAGGAIKNSLYLGIVSTVVATVTSTIAAYALSRRRVPFKGTMLIVVLFLSGLPVTLLLIPIYEIFVKLGWVGSPFYTSLVLASTSVPFAIWLLKSFIDQVPTEFEEAAAIEGAGELRVLWRVVVPLALPGILVAAILTFINSWGAFLLPLVIDALPGNTPGAVGIYQFQTANGQIQFGPLCAYGILFSLPVIVLYLISSRWLSGGFAFAGGVKG
jgi:multiple sugar transport system permease protein